MFKGTLTAIITPFLGEPKENPAVDYDVLADLIEWQLGCGIEGFVICGTTGESATLSDKEKLSLIKFVAERVKGRVPIIAGTGTNCTLKSVELTRAAKDIGVDGVLLVSPYYNKPTQEGLFQHFSRIAEEGALPVIIYNIPGRTSVDIAVETFERLAQVPNIVAVKEASGSADKLMTLAAAIGDKLDILSGEDALTFEVMAAGGTGVISASSNVIPELMLQITTLAAEQKYSPALTAQLKALPIIRALFAETNPGPAKAALMMMGKIPSDTVRMPLVPVKDETRKLLRKVLTEEKILS